MPRTAKVSEKNTKGEILDAYQQLLAQASSGEDAVSPEDAAAVAFASKETVEKITKDLSGLKLSVTQTISELTDRLTQEAERFGTIQKAINIAQKELGDLHQIKVRAGMLKRMVELQKEKEEEFERETAGKRRAWEEEQRLFEDQQKHGRTRDEEEYRYQRDLIKKRDEDEREEATHAFERGMASRKEEYAKQGKELEELRKRIAQVPAEADKAVKEAVAVAVAKEKEIAGVASQLAKQSADSDLKLAQLKSVSLEELVKSQVAEIARLNRELATATAQVKDIAIAVAEGQRKEPSTSSGKTPSAS